MAVRPCKDRSGWYVEVWWLKRPSEEIGHFRTHGDARKWIEIESACYFALREIESMMRPRGGPDTRAVKHDTRRAAKIGYSTISRQMGGGWVPGTSA